MGYVFFPLAYLMGASDSSDHDVRVSFPVIWKSKKLFLDRNTRNITGGRINGDENYSE